MAEARMAFPQLRHPFEKVAVDAGEGAIVICNERVINVAKVLDEPGLWVSPEDLTRINGFVLKPEGACLDELCIPIRSGSNLLKTLDGASWFNVAAFADLLEQSYVVDKPSRVWSFGEIPAAREAMLANAQAPDFELLDRQGKVVRMADYKGKKALVITWSSW